VAAAVAAAAAAAANMALRVMTICFTRKSHCWWMICRLHGFLLRVVQAWVVLIDRLEHRRL
jgi:hypothetical protein